MQRSKGDRPRRTSDAFPRGARLLVSALCLMVCAVPLLFLSGVYEPDFSPRLFALHLCIALACLGWLIQTRWGKNVHLISSPLFLPALCLLAVALLSAPATTHPLDTAVEIVNQAALIVLLLVVAHALPLEWLTPVLWSSALTGLAVALIGILQYHSLSFFDIPSAAPPSATFVNRNFAAEYLICAIPLSGLLFVTAGRRVALLLSGLSATLMGVFLIYTRTRAAWVGALGALLCLGAALLAGPGLRRGAWEAVGSYMDRGKWRMGAEFLLLFVLLSALPPHRSDLPESKASVIATAASPFQEEGIKDASVSERLAFWTNTLHMVADHPLGVGPGGWKRAYPPYDGGATISSEYSAKWPHNDYIEIASEYGLLGLGVYLWFLVAGFGCLLKMAQSSDPFPRIAALTFALSFLAFIGDAFFAFPKSQPQAVMFPYLLFGLAAGATARRRIELRARSGGLLGLTFLLVVSLGAAELSRRRIGFDRHYLNALYLGKARGDWPTLLTEVRRALEYGNFRPHILTFKGIALQHLERHAEAEAAYRQALAYAPHAWRVHAGLGSTLIQQGRLDEALRHCQTALSLCPDALDVRSNLAMIYHQKGDPGRAEQEIRAVLQINPQDVRAHHYLATLFVARGQLDSAVACYERALRIDPLPQTHANLADAYRQQGRLQDALPHYQKAVRAYPNNPDVLWGLGLALEAGGQRPQAEALYRRAIALRPDFAQAYFALGNALYESGNYQEARSAYRTFLDLWRGDPSYAQFAREQLIRCEEKSQKK